jgi:hypothetical protein
LDLLRREELRLADPARLVPQQVVLLQVLLRDLRATRIEQVRPIDACLNVDDEEEVWPFTRSARQRDLRSQSVSAGGHAELKKVASCKHARAAIPAPCIGV